MKKPAMTTFDLMMYLTFIALIAHYAQPSYELIFTKIRAQQFLQPIKVAQLMIEEYFFFQQQLPEDIHLPDKKILELSWDGQSLLCQSTDEQLELILYPQIEHFGLTWSCENKNDSLIGGSLCHALT